MLLSNPLHILICPLDWGLGHAARCVPVIHQLIEAGHKVTLAGQGRSLTMLSKEFPSLQCIQFPGFSPAYPRSGNMALHLFLLLPSFFSHIVREHRTIKSLITQYEIDIIISDNRYGLWNKKIKSILILHQVMIKTPGWLRFAEYPIYLFSRFLINRFDECWIPDHAENPGLSGDLSHKYKLPGNARFIGPLSRFEKTEHAVGTSTLDNRIAVILSGPEPQRSILEEIVKKQLSDLNYSATIVSGKPESDNTEEVEKNIIMIPHLTTAGLSTLISASSLVICRSGYTSIMDLNAIGAKALFVPTPGQTEQNYLARLHQKAGHTLFRKQEDLNLHTDIAEALTYTGFTKEAVFSALKSTIAGLRKK